MICSVLYRFLGILPPAVCARILTLGLVQFQGARSTKQRWDGANLHKVEGTYGDYLLQKVAKGIHPHAAAVHPRSLRLFSLI